MRNYLIALAVIVVAAVCYVLFTTDRRTDEVQVTSLVDEITKAANARDLSKSMSYISENFVYESDINKDRLRMLVAQAFRSETNFSMQTTLKSLTINGDEANAVIYVDIKGWNEGSENYQKDVNVILKKEPAKRLLVFPSSKWRVTNVDSLVVSGYD